MTLNQLNKRISESNADQMVKAQAIALNRQCWVEPRLIPMEELFSMACKCAGVSVADGLYGNKQMPKVRARQLFAHYGSQWYSVTEMGKFILKDHTCIIHNRNRAAWLIKHGDDIILFDIENMERLIAGEKIVPPVPRVITHEEKKYRAEIYERNLAKRRLKAHENRYQPKK